MPDGPTLGDTAQLLGVFTALLRRMAETEHTNLLVDPPEKVEAIYCLLRAAELLGLAFAGEQARRGSVDAAAGGDLQGDARAIEALLRDALVRLGWDPARTRIDIANRAARPDGSPGGGGSG